MFVWCERKHNVKEEYRTISHDHGTLFFSCIYLLFSLCSLCRLCVHSLLLFFFFFANKTPKNIPTTFSVMHLRSTRPDVNNNIHSLFASSSFLLTIFFVRYLICSLYMPNVTVKCVKFGVIFSFTKF